MLQASFNYVFQDWRYGIWPGLCIVTVADRSRRKFAQGIEIPNPMPDSRDGLTRAFAAGHFPHWDPSGQGGVPLLANIHAGVLYPPNALYRLKSGLYSAI